MKKTLPRKMAFDICPVGEIKSTFQFNFFIIHIDDDVFSLSHIILIGSDCSINRGVHICRCFRRHPHTCEVSCILLHPDDYGMFKHMHN